MNSTVEGSARPKRWETAVFVVILLAALAARVAGAWHMRCITDPDSSVVALMVKHMALAMDFPIFFYGQLYMGSFEPAVSAFLCKIFGVSGFMVNLGTALVAVFLIPVVYAWGRDAGGPAAGLSAAAFCIVGSPAFFAFQYNPRGGYAAVIVLGALVLWMAGRIASDYRAGYKPGSFMLGLAAGFGWWDDPLIAMALVAACVVLLIGLRTKALMPGFWFPGLIGFFLGGSPFWIWNACHEWAGIVALLNVESRPLSEGATAFVDRAQRAIGLAGLPPYAWWAALLLFASSALCAISRVATLVKRRTLDVSDTAILSALAMLASAFLIFGTSQFSKENTARYLLPMVPAMAVLVGVLVAACAKRHIALTVLPLGAVILLQARTPQIVARDDDYAAVVRTIVPMFQEALPKLGIRTVYVTFREYPLNFHTDEATDFPLIDHERSSRLVERAESDPSPAFMAIHKELMALLSMAGGSCDRVDLGGLLLLHNLRPPPVAWTPLPPDTIRGGSTSDGASDARDVTDLRRGTYWYFRRDQDRRKWAEIHLDGPRDICGLRMVCPEVKLTPGMWSIEGRLEDGTWKPLLPDTVIPGLFWSGPRPHLAGRYVRHEARFETTRVTALRLGFPTAPKTPRWGISGLEVFAPGEALAPESPEQVSSLIATLRLRRIRSLYADRWIANEVWHRSAGTIATSREEPRRVGERGPERPVMGETGGLGVLVRKDGAPLTRSVFSQSSLRFEETEIGPWILFDRFSGSATNVEWAGFAAMLK